MSPDWKPTGQCSHGQTGPHGEPTITCPGPPIPFELPPSCTCQDDGGCIDYYDEQRPGDCAYCQDPRFGVNDVAVCPAILAIETCGGDS